MAFVWMTSHVHFDSYRFSLYSQDAQIYNNEYNHLRKGLYFSRPNPQSHGRATPQEGFGCPYALSDFSIPSQIFTQLYSLWGLRKSLNSLPWSLQLKSLFFSNIYYLVPSLTLFFLPHFIIKPYLHYFLPHCILAASHLQGKHLFF